MGASLWTIILTEVTKAEVTERWNAICAHKSAVFNGDDCYDGFISLTHEPLKFVDMPFENKAEALLYLSEHHPKWEGAWALRFSAPAGHSLTLVGGWAAC